LAGFLVITYGRIGVIPEASVFRVLQLAVLGTSPGVYLVFDTCFTIATEFHHSNWRLPFRFELLLNNVFVTPRMHGIHHSIVREETNSNYSTMFSCWDRLNGSFRSISQTQDIVIGVPAYRGASDQQLGPLLLLPFRKQRKILERIKHSLAIVELYEAGERQVQRYRPDHMSELRANSASVVIDETFSKTLQFLGRPVYAGAELITLTLLTYVKPHVRRACQKERPPMRRPHWAQAGACAGSRRRGCRSSELATTLQCRTRDRRGFPE
jgi:hypothetical protein